jgi:hypothetical protein
MRHATTTALVTIGVIAIGVLALNVLGGDATADTKPTGTTSPPAPAPSTVASTTEVRADPAPATPDTTWYTHVDIQPRIETRAVDPGMVLSGEHVVTSEEVYGTTDAANGEPSDK